MNVENPQMTERWKPWTNLGLAIIEQACCDYITARYARLSFPKTDKGPTQMEVDCVKFFHNKEHPAWFINIDPEKIMTALNELVDEALENKHSPRLHDLQLNSPRYRKGGGQ